MPVVERGGCRLFYEVEGEGPPLVLAAGLGGTASWWAPQRERWAREFTLLSFDQRGTGRSSRVPVASVGQMADDLLAVLDDAGIARAPILGHSTGGAIGLSLALDHPDRVSALLIYASTTCGDPYRHRVLGLRKMLLALGGAEAYARYTSLLLHPPYFINANSERLEAEERAAAESLGAPEVQGSRLDAILGFDRRAELARLRLPVRILCAEDDILTPAYFSEEYARLIPGAELRLVPRGGHALSRTEPGIFDAEVLPFLRRHAA